VTRVAGFLAGFALVLAGGLGSGLVPPPAPLCVAAASIPGCEDAAAPGAHVPGSIETPGAQRPPADPAPAALPLREASDLPPAPKERSIGTPPSESAPPVIEAEAPKATPRRPVADAGSPRGPEEAPAPNAAPDRPADGSGAEPAAPPPAGDLADPGDGGWDRLALRFRSERSAEGLARELGATLEAQVRAVRDGPGRYGVEIAWRDAGERARLRAALAALLPAAAPGG
jgi:hypothetical protein